MIDFMTTTLAALEFLSLPMLGWLVAAALPWLIYRWQQSRHQTTPWAAVELLLNAMQQQARCVQLQQWLLLAVRTAILLLVIFAATEPILRQWAGNGSNQAHLHRIIVVDQSYSMGCKESGTTRWQRARSHARRWIEGSDRNAITLIGWASQTENFFGRPTFDKSIALSALGDLPLTQTSAELPAVLRSITAAIDRAEVEIPQINTHQVVFCTDMGRQAWSINERQRTLLEAVAKRAQVTIVNVAEGECDNLAITDLMIDPAITLQQRDTNIAATISCFGKSPSTPTTVELLVDGQQVDHQQIKLKKDIETIVRFPYRFVDSGAQTVQVVLADAQDALPSDNERWLLVNVQPKLQVACFAEHPSAVTDLVRALAPSDARIDSNSSVTPQTFPISQLGELELSSYAAIFLGSVAQLSGRETKTLTEYVRQGGALAIFLGEDTDVESFNRNHLLPSLHVESFQSAGDYRFDPLGYRHPIVSPFRGMAQSGLLGVTISQYFRLQLSEENSEAEAEVVLKFNTGDPALIVGRRGLGRVAVSALPGSLAARTATGTPWSSFAMSPSFLPVIRELLTYLVGDRWLQQRNLVVGEPAIFPANLIAKTTSVRLPSGARQTLPSLDAEGRGQRVFRKTDQRGVYRFAEDEKETARFVVNLNGHDSDLRSLDEAALPIDISVSFTGSTIGNDITPTSLSGDFPLARNLLACAFALLLLETGLAWQLGRRWG